jgi:hypothetical protein
MSFHDRCEGAPEGIQERAKGERPVLWDGLPQEGHYLLCLARLQKGPAELRLAHSSFACQQN